VYKIVSHDDPNIEHLIVADNVRDAALTALDLLGWGLCEETNKGDTPCHRSTENLTGQLELPLLGAEP
jgi:hypothetical protein